MSIRRLRDLPADTRGFVISLQFALSAAAMVLLLLGALDFVRIQMLHARMQSALDLAVLAAGRNLAGDWQADANAYLAANMPSGYLNASYDAPSFTEWPDDAGTHVKMSANLTVPLLVTGMTGILPQRYAIASQALVKFKNVEMVLALDNTGSMGSNGKIQALRTAATDLINYMLGPNSSDNVHLGLVPFTETVRIGNSTLTQSWLDPAQNRLYSLGNWQGCLAERPNSTGSYSITDTRTPLDAKFPVYEASQLTASGGWWGQSTQWQFQYQNSQAYCVLAPVQFLTSDAKALDAAVANMQAQGSTLIASGALWGWRMLLPSWRNAAIWGSSTLPLDKSPQLTRVLVLLTDGDNQVQGDSAQGGWPQYYQFYSPYGNARQVSPYGNITGYDNSNADSMLRTLCSAMKDDGVVIYTIPFGTDPSTDSKNLLQSCASDATKFLPVPNPQNLQAAFQNISGSLSELVIEH